MREESVGWEPRRMRRNWPRPRDGGLERVVFLCLDEIKAKQSRTIEARERREGEGR